MGREGRLVDHDHLPLLALQLQDGPAAGGGGGGGGAGGDRRDERGEETEGPDGPHGPDSPRIPHSTSHHIFLTDIFLHIVNSGPGKTEKQSFSPPAN